MGVKLKGWDSLERLMRERKYTETEIEDARRSFRHGLDILYRVYIKFLGEEKGKDSDKKSEDSAQGQAQNRLSNVV